jgi:hypothetical protein
MRFIKTLGAAFFLIVFFVCPLFAADLNYPYINENISMPPIEDPFPGFGTYYTTLSRGMKTALWNAASLGKLKLSESSLSVAVAAGSHSASRTFNLAELGGTFEATAGSGAIGSYGIFFRNQNVIGSGINTREVSLLSAANYISSSTGANFSSALKVNDWLAVGFAINNPVAAGANIAGDFPITAKAVTDFYGKKVSEMQINTAGKLTYTFTSGGLTTTYESTSPLWSGFLTQEAVMPLTSLSELKNDFNFHSPYLGTIASKYKDFYFGLNMVPVSATANIDNTVNTIVNADAQDIFLYVPNFDQSNQNELASWINDPSKYGASSGYQRKQVRLPAGEIISTARYRGFYAASTARFDLGAMYDLSDWFTVGMAMENISGSTLNFKGNGISTYLSYRNYDTSEAGNVGDLFSPSGKKTLDFITDTWITTYEVGDYNFYLEPEKTYTLPKKVRLGFSLKRPFLIALDYEQCPSSITFGGTTEATNIKISNLNIVRLGIEFPFWTRMGLALMLKPSFNTADSNYMKTFNQYFKYGVFPVKFDFGNYFNLWGYEIEDSLGFNFMPVIDMLQGDLTNADMSKLSFGGVTIGKDAWKINYFIQTDTIASAVAYYNKPVAAGSTRNFQFSDIKYTQTLGVTYRF